jgi:signal transduction histidine kinase/CHASE3 domain sensor protein
MRLGLGARILIAGGIVVLFLVVEFVLVLRQFQHVRTLTRSEQRAEQSVVAASRVEKLVLDLETGTRGYLITRDRRFLAPSRVARTSLPAETRAFQALAPGPVSDEVAVGARAYIRDWAVPVAAIARVSGDAAVVEAATREGKRRVDELRAVIDQFIRSQNRLATSERERIASVERTGIVYAAAGIVITTLLFMAFVGYFLRAAIAPLRRIADATNRVAAGERQVEVPEEGAGEVGELAVAFNDMSRALTAQTRELADQNVDLERLANVLRAVLDSTVDGILLSDAQGNVQLANRPVVTLTRDLGMSYEGSVVDRLLSVQARMRDPEGYRAAMERLRSNPDESTFDEFEDAASGRVFQGFTSPVQDDRGGPLGRIWTLREVTQQRELDRLKDDFVATVSHELRTPLTSMMGFLEMIREGEAGELNDQQKRFLAIVYRSSERLQRLVGDLLFVARLDANGLQLRFGEARLDEIVRESVESSSALARSREVELVAEVDDVPPVSGDKDRLAQLVGNLVSNALKFTPAGGRVTVRAFRDGGNAVMEIQDTGIGIPEAEQGRLFQRFFRSSTATEQAIPGTGLGLVISKAIAEAHGGTIGVISASGEGTCFRVEIPLDPEEIAA